MLLLISYSTPKNREDFGADFVIWMDTVEGRFEDTNKMFVKPSKFDYRVTEKNAEYFAKISQKLRACSSVVERFVDIEGLSSILITFHQKFD